MMNEIFNMMKSEFEIAFSHFYTEGIRKREKLEKEIIQEIKVIQLNYPKRERAREHMKHLYIDVCFEINTAINVNVNRYLRYALLNFHWGEYEWDRKYQAEGVWFMVQATRALGLWQGYSEGLGHCAFQKSVQQRRKSSGEEGGITRAGRYQPVKEEFVRLLRDEMPERGWGTKRDAVDAIEAKLWRFIDGHYKKAFDKENIQRRKVSERERKPFSMVRENLDRTMLDWSRNDEKVRVAFEQVVKKNNLLERMRRL